MCCVANVSLIMTKKYLNEQTEFVNEPINFFEIAKLLAFFAIRKINLQHRLFFAVFLLFGLGDGITGAIMMEKYGPYAESNPIMRDLFMSGGFWNVVMAKMWMIFGIFVIIYIIKLRSYDGVYWTINGFLTALAVGGWMALNANLAVLAGETPKSPNEIIFIYLALVLILIELGSLIDRRQNIKKRYGSN